MQVEFSLPIALESDWFQPLNLSSEKLGFKICFQNVSCPATLRGCTLFDVDTMASNMLEHGRERAAAFAASHKGGKKKKGGWKKAAPKKAAGKKADGKDGKGGKKGKKGDGGGEGGDGGAVQVEYSRPIA